MVAAVLAACSSLGPRVEKPVIDPHGNDAGDQTTGCMTDSECGASQVCVNCAGNGECAPGCRDASQCAAREICQLGTVCQACPCAPGWCVIDPCRDEDNDGFVPSDDVLLDCPGKQRGDCNDRAPDVHPGAAELCQNYRDDNCDGKVDERDSACVCASGKQHCTTNWDCGDPGGAGCVKGCCEPCANQTGTKPTCNFGGGNYCPQQYGVNPNTGCSYGWTCDSCGSCGATVDPVCGANGSTYDNTCLMQQRGTKLMHRGACLPGEGMFCQVANQPWVPLDGGCGSSGDFYCRSNCPAGSSCGSSVCTQKGACLTDSDCPAGLPLPTPADCDGGAAVLRCVSNACVSRCG